MVYGLDRHLGVVGPAAPCHMSHVTFDWAFSTLRHVTLAS